MTELGIDMTAITGSRELFRLMSDMPANVAWQFASDLASGHRAIGNGYTAWEAGDGRYLLQRTNEKSLAER
jgi:hypothetical protein